MKVNLYDFVFGDSFLSMTPKHEQQQQEKQVTQISSKLKTVVLQETYIDFYCDTYYKKFLPICTLLMFFDITNFILQLSFSTFYYKNSQ